ncbi:MAG: flagellar biosynthetic protein FliO [Alphaproteobacteria bacterium]|nr:flagellar biosynthetic protein FliO [Alphaproteobacteria bacterium]
MEVIDGAQLGRFIAALVFVLGLMFLLSQVMKRYNGHARALPGIRKKRLQIIEVLAIDSRRRAVLIRRDDREHLVLLGATTDTVIESNIESPQDKPHEHTVEA